MITNLARWSTGPMLALTLTGCYVMPIQVEEGKPPVYAYMPVGSGQPTAASMPARPVVPMQPAAVIHVRLYPLNDTAAKWGPLEGKVRDQLSGRGRFSVQVPGEDMHGEATRVPEGFPGFGRIIQETLAQSLASASKPLGRGIANAYGTRGAYANCEYVLSTGGMGTGACKYSNGAKYQLHFGS